MKVLIFGSDGFVGRHVAAALEKDHSIYGAGMDSKKLPNYFPVDLVRPETIRRTLQEVNPEIIINCAGVVDKGERAKLNPLFTSNILQEIAASGIQCHRVIISGSAAEYGVVDEKDLPVREEAPLNAASDYGLSKVEEETLARKFGETHNLPVITARIFNPIGPNMNPIMLLPSLIQQVQDIKSGKKSVIELSRLDAKRDYIDIRDVALAFKALVDHNPTEMVYNMGSGKSTSNQELIALILKHSKLDTHPEIKETSEEPEPLMAIQADVSRLSQEFSWHPSHSLEETIKEIINA